MLLGHSVCADLLGWILADPDSALKAVQNIIYTNQSATTLSVPAHSHSSAAGLAITTYIPWTSRLSYGIMGTIGFLNSPESAHDALQKVLDPKYIAPVVTAQISPASALDSTAAASTAATLISLTNEAPHAAPASTSLTLNSLTTEAPHAESASSATRTPTLITGNPGTVTHIMDFEADATPIVPEFRTYRRSSSLSKVESDDGDEGSLKTASWLRNINLNSRTQVFPHALLAVCLLLVIGLSLECSQYARAQSATMRALQVEREARKRAEAALAPLDENRQHGLVRPHEVETLKASLKAARTTSSDQWAALQKCWLQIEELKQQVELNEVSYRSKMRSKDAELKGLLKKISQSEVEFRTPLEDHNTRQKSTERDPVAASENGNNESANIRTIRSSSPQTTSESLHDEESNEDSSAKQAAAPGGNDDDESATNRSTIPSGPQDATIPLPYGAGEDRSTPSHTAAPSAYGGGESAPQSKPLLGDNIDDDTTNNDAPAPGENGGSESATDDRTIPQAGQDDDEPLRDANTVNDTTANEAPAPAEYGDDGSVSDHSTIPPARGDDMHVTQSTEALAGTGGDESVRDHSSIPLADSDNTHVTQSVGAPDGAGSDGTVRDHGTIPQATGDITHIPQSIGALTETRGGAMTTDAAISPTSGSFTVQTQILPTASPFPAAKVQSLIKRGQKQMSSPLRPNNAKTGIQKRASERQRKKPVRRVDIPSPQQYVEQLVSHATAVGEYGGGEMTMGEPEHLPPPPQHYEQLLPMAAAPGPRGDAEIEPPAEQVVDDMAVDDEPVVAVEEQPVEMELDGEEGEQMKVDGEGGERMKVDEEGGEQMKVDGEGGEQMKVGGEGGEQMKVDAADGPAADQQDGNGRDVDDEATVAHQQQNNVQPPVRLAQLSFFQQGKQERMERSRKTIAQARDSLIAAKEEKEVNGSKWSKVEIIRYDAKLAKLRMDFNNKKDGFKFAYGEDA
ncbi:hypothetical protein LTS10_003219 [Elasticomyces elasticus]|nr:hypothetical protein LTS10_003219 [Elasticomyces elasticus]